MTRIYFLANIRLPTEKAHGLTIVKSCDALARTGAEVTLVIPERKTHLQKDIFELYGVEKNFYVHRFPAINWLYLGGRWTFWFTYVIFALQIFWMLLFVQRKDTVIYTREVLLTPLALLGFPVIFESHHVYAKQTLFFMFARLSRKIVVISHALKDKFIRAGFAEQRIAVEPSGVELATFTASLSREEAREQLSLPQNTSIVLYTGNFTSMGEDKGIHDILRAMQQLKDVLFVAVGGSEKDRERYLLEARTLDVEARVQLVGFVLQPVLAQYQCAADVLLMPFPDTPHYRSNMSPVKMFEYMASGKPIIATDLPTIREVLNEHNAVIIPPSDASALAQAVQTLLADTVRAKRLAAQAKEEVVQYSWDKRSERIRAFIATT